MDSEHSHITPEINAMASTSNTRVRIFFNKFIVFFFYLVLSIWNIFITLDKG